MDVPRSVLAVGAALLLAGVAVSGVGVYRQAAFECDDTLSLTHHVPNEPVGVGGTAVLEDSSTDEQHGGAQLRAAAVETVCSRESTPHLASLLQRGGALLALSGAALSASVVAWRRSERVRRLLR